MIGADALDSDSVMSMVIQMVIRGVQRTTNMEKRATKVWDVRSAPCSMTSFNKSKTMNSLDVGACRHNFCFV